MRILSWNINGIRTLPQYHPWNSFKACEGILNELSADIICFQEMKSSRQILPRDVAIPENYCSFFSFPITKGGYSGVAVYTKTETAAPLKAEEGLSGNLQPKPALSLDERISSMYPTVDDIECWPDEAGDYPDSLDFLDAEGRGLIIDFGLFVLINVYCPNETSDARLSFKMNYHLLLESRVKALIQAGREVIVLGDMNICATPLDHCDGHLPSNANSFWEHPARAWFHKWLHPLGPMVDVVRTFWPERKGLYTCWNTKISARDTNYGTRVDYILVTQGLLKWIKHGDILPSLKGSDHCPIYIDLHDEINLESGETLVLRKALHQGDRPRDPPRLAAKYWKEFSGKQHLLSNFFTKKKAEVDQSDALQPSPSPPLLERDDITSMTGHTENKGVVLQKSVTLDKPTKKRTLSQTAVASASSSKKSKRQHGQATLGSFFQKSQANLKASSSRSMEIIDVDGDQDPSPSSDAIPTPTPHDDTSDQLDADYRLACELAASEGEPSSSPPAPSSQNKAAWTSLFTPIHAPKCTVHGEPAKKFTVNKPGPNKGRVFYVCSRPVGPGYDKGRGERLREEVDHQYKCNFFKWASDIKREPALSQS